MPLPTRRLRLIAPGLSDRLLSVRKVMGSPSCCCRDRCIEAVDWARRLDNISGDGDSNEEERESRDMCECSDEDFSFGCLEAITDRELIADGFLVVETCVMHLRIVASMASLVPS